MLNLSTKRRPEGLWVIPLRRLPWRFCDLPKCSRVAAWRLRRYQQGLGFPGHLDLCDECYDAYLSIEVNGRTA